MIGRLLIGIVKGLIVGSLLGFGLVKLGMAMPIAIVAYVAAALTGVLIGLVAGKPIWAKDAKIEAGTKAFVGALLALGLMAAARNWLMVPLPISLGTLAPEHAGQLTLGGFAMTALAAIAALLGGFYEADNDSTGEEEATPEGAKDGKVEKGRRIAATQTPGAEEEELESEPDKKRSKK
jgi:hypothetical protein